MTPGTVARPSIHQAAACSLYLGSFPKSGIAFYGWNISFCLQIKNSSSLDDGWMDGFIYLLIVCVFVYFGDKTTHCLKVQPLYFQDFPRVWLSPQSPGWPQWLLLLLRNFWATFSFNRRLAMATASRCVPCREGQKASPAWATGKLPRAIWSVQKVSRDCTIVPSLAIKCNLSSAEPQRRGGRAMAGLEKGG